MSVGKPSASADYRADIDGLRAVAVGSVVVYHAAPSYLPGGFIGVDVFFVISGYLITGILLSDIARGDFSIGRFYNRRVRRIFPALITVLLTCLIFGWFYLMPDDLAQLAKHAIAGATFTSNIVLWSESGYFDAAAETKPLLHLWSLGVEEQFYIVWPLLIAALYRYVPKAVMGWVIGLALVSFVVNLVQTPADPSSAFYLPHTRFWELLAGALLAMAHSRRPVANGRASSSRRSEVLSLLGLAVIVGCCFAYDENIGFPGIWALPPVLATVAILAFAPSGRVTRSVLVWRPMVLIGLISYPLYLWHMPLLTFLRTTTIAEASITNRLIAVALSVLLAIATYRFIERPVRFGRRVPSNRTAWTLVGTMTLAASVSAAVVHRDGYPTRYPAELAGLFEVSRSAREVQEQSFTKGRCFLEPTESADRFGSQCSIAADAPPSSVPEVLLWGDSHAAHLAPGLIDLLSPNKALRFSRLTASGCPPLLDYDVAHKRLCRGINEYVARYVERQRPSVVVLAANWMSHDFNRLDSTLRLLNGSGVKHVVLVGPVPKWQVPLPKVVLQSALSSPDHLPARYTSSRLDGRVFDLDDRMRKWAQARGIDYRSPLRQLCEQGRCLSLSGDDFSTITSRDDAHLTELAAQYLIPRLLPDLAELAVASGGDIR